MTSEIITWMRQNPKKIFQYLLFLLLISLPLFCDLNTLPLRIFDESRLAVSAFEMHKFGDYIVTHIQGSPDMWNTKPPLVIWLQVLCIKLFGASDLSVRLPSAFAAAFTCILMMVFSVRYLKSFWIGFAASLVLVTTHGYVWMHGTRSADYDAPLAFFMAFYAIAFYAYSVTKKNIFLTLTFIGIILAALTKGVGGLLFIPAIILFAFIQKNVPGLLRNKTFYLNVVAFLIVVIGYYLLREHYNPGYLKAVWENELGGRYLQVNEAHEGGFWFYYNNFIDFQFSYWYILVPVGAIIGLTNKDQRIRKFSLFCILVLITFFLVISSGKTKLQWYDIPMYPFLSFIIAMFVQWSIQLVENIATHTSIRISVVPYVVMWFIYIQPYKAIVNETYMPVDTESDKEYIKEEYFLKNSIDNKRDLNGYSMCYSGYATPNIFYTYVLNDMGEKFNFVTSGFNFKPGDKIIVSQPDIQDTINKKYNWAPIDSVGEIKMRRIISKK
jgi:4-amino-4-deoxy-L-arabinose transferase-like glycosyltransferase